MSQDVTPIFFLVSAEDAFDLKFTSGVSLRHHSRAWDNPLAENFWRSGIGQSTSHASQGALEHAFHAFGGAGLFTPHKSRLRPKGTVQANLAYNEGQESVLIGMTVVEKDDGIVEITWDGAYMCHDGFATTAFLAGKGYFKAETERQAEIADMAREAAGTPPS